jgi:hypothetical protein
LHWAYKIFIRKQQFLNNEPLVKPELYASMILNPDDNRENLPVDYIGDILDTLPEKQRDRFKLGLWVKAEGVIYEKVDEAMILDDELIHFRDWNPWNAVRGVNPLASLSLEQEQDYWANRANTDLLKNGAVPQGIIKADHVIRPLWRI